MASTEHALFILFSIGMVIGPVLGYVAQFFSIISNNLRYRKQYIKVCNKIYKEKCKGNLEKNSDYFSKPPSRGLEAKIPRNEDKTLKKTQSNLHESSNIVDLSPMTSPSGSYTRDDSKLLNGDIMAFNTNPTPAPLSSSEEQREIIHVDPARFSISANSSDLQNESVCSLRVSSDNFFQTHKQGKTNFSDVPFVRSTTADSNVEPREPPKRGRKGTDLGFAPQRAKSPDVALLSIHKLEYSMVEGEEEKPSSDKQIDKIVEDEDTILANIVSPVDVRDEEQFYLLNTSCIAGFAPLVSLILICANTIRIYYYIGNRYPLTMLLQSIVMITVQLLLVMLIAQVIIQQVFLLEKYGYFFCVSLEKEDEKKEEGVLCLTFDTAPGKSIGEADKHNSISNRSLTVFVPIEQEQRLKKTNASAMGSTTEELEDSKKLQKKVLAPIKATGSFVQHRLESVERVLLEATPSRFLTKNNTFLAKGAVQDSSVSSVAELQHPPSKIRGSFIDFDDSLGRRSDHTCRSNVGDKFTMIQSKNNSIIGTTKSFRNGDGRLSISFAGNSAPCQAQRSLTRRASLAEKPPTRRLSVQLPQTSASTGERNIPPLFPRESAPPMLHEMPLYAVDEGTALSTETEEKSLDASSKYNYSCFLIIFTAPFSFLLPRNWTPSFKDSITPTLAINSGNVYCNSRVRREYINTTYGPWVFLVQYLYFVFCFGVFVFALCWLGFLIHVLSSHEKVHLTTDTYLFNPINQKIFIVLGFVALLVEASLMMPQIYHNYKRKSCHGISLLLLFTWVGGDAIKMIYFLISSQPMPFIACGIMQLSLDTVLMFQIIWYDIIDLIEDKEAFDAAEEQLGRTISCWERFKISASGIGRRSWEFITGKPRKKQ